MRSDASDTDPVNASDTLYGPAYYASHCGPVPYARTPHWLGFFSHVAEELVRSFAPRRVFDAGCALGLLVECLWDRGVEAHGRDISNWAVEQIRADVRPFCEAGSIADPIVGNYDLVTCIEVLEHMPEAEALRAIATMAGAAPRILFSSSPTDLDEPTHCNVRPTMYWLARWAEVGFAPMPLHNASYLASHAFILERSDIGRSATELATFAELVRRRLEIEQLSIRREYLEVEVKTAAHARLDTDTSLTEMKARLTEMEARNNAAETIAAEARQACEIATQSVTDATTRAIAAEQRAADIDVAVAAVRTQSRLNLDDSIVQIQAVFDKDLAHRKTDFDRRRNLLTKQIADMHASAASQQKTLETLNAQLIAAQAEVDRAVNSEAKAVAAVEHERALAAAAQHASVSSAEALEAMRDMWLRASAERDRLLNSASWRAMWPVRAGAELLPRQARRIVRQALTLGWWTISGQLLPRVKQRRTIVRDTRVVASAALFDAVWYSKQNPEVEASGLDPALHYVTVGGLRGRDPGPAFSASHYAKMHSDLDTSRRPALLYFLERKDQLGLITADSETSSLAMNASTPEIFTETAVESTAPPPHGSTGIVEEIPVSGVPAGVTPPTLRDQFLEAHVYLKLPPVVRLPHSGRRLNVVVDSINAGSLYGGVATSLILAAMLCRRLDATLRIITRREEAIGSNVSRLFNTHDIEWSGNIDFFHLPYGDSNRVLAIDHGDIFLTTSWWSTRLVSDLVKPSRIIYLLQEDERMFYPRGDERLYAEQTIATPGIHVVINSELLFRHLTEGSEPIRSLSENATWFEPAFPSAQCDFDAAEARGASGRRNLIFYARPSNLRNLYHHGTQMLATAIEQGILDPAAWNITFVGRDLHNVCVDSEHGITLLENLSWDQYASLITNTDLGIALIETPHPSYPPLDLAASGAVALTNTCLNKTSLERYSDNIICADIDVNSLTRGLAEAIELACNLKRRRANFADNRLQHRWVDTLGPVIDRLKVSLSEGL